MVYGAIDLHSRFSQIRLVDAQGAMLREQRIATTRERLVAALAGFGAMRILVEASTESEWVAQTLEATGHELIVADPNYAPMYAARQRRIKTDRRDVAALAEACRLGIYRRAHRVSRAQRRLRQQLGVGRQLVQRRTELISPVRALLRQEGFRLPSGSSPTVVDRLGRLDLPAALRTVLLPLLEALTTVTPTIAATTRALTAQADTDPVAVRLQSVPGVGAIVALTYRATLDDVARFAGASQVSSALGLVPAEDSSGERCRRGTSPRSGRAKRARC
jgi:transposase